MGILGRIFGAKGKGDASSEDATAVVPVPATALEAPGSEPSTWVEPRQAVIVRFAYGGGELGPLFELQSRLEGLVDEKRLGEVDGHEVATDGSDKVLTLYGPEADALFAAVRPVLESAAFMKGARVTVRYGAAGDGARESEIVLGG